MFRLLVVGGGLAVGLIAAGAVAAADLKRMKERRSRIVPNNRSRNNPYRYLKPVTTKA